MTISLPGLAQISYSNLHTFTNNGTGGSEPTAGVILDHAGNLYGTTYSGGEYDLGTVFKLSKGSDGKWREAVLHSFGRDGSSSPTGNLVFDSVGNLYGVTTNGGGRGEGTAFELIRGSDGTWTEKLLYTFCSLNNCVDGARPYSALTIDRAGNLYGTTFSGGSSSCEGGCGTVFKLKPDQFGDWSEKVLYAFCPTTECVDGRRPLGSVIFDNQGNLYGTTQLGGNLSKCLDFGVSDGCGVVFELTPGSGGPWSETVLYDFCSISNCDDGTLPSASPIFDAQGNLYGTAAGGGVKDDGVVFELVRGSDGSWTEKILHSFKGTDGYNPFSNLIFDQAGNLYGTAPYGGPKNSGVAFVLTPNSDGTWDDIILHNFDDNPAAAPGGLTMDSAGNLYGATEGDYNRTFGSVFEITP